MPRFWSDSDNYRPAKVPRKAEIWLPRHGAELALVLRMLRSIPTALAAVMPQDFAEQFRNVLGDSFRAIARLIHGHETLVIVILVMLVIIYLYIRKA